MLPLSTILLTILRVVTTQVPGNQLSISCDFISMDAANQILVELNGRVDAGDVDGGMVALSKIKVSFDLV